MAGTRGSLLDLDVGDFEVSDILEAYLTDPKTRPIYNDISTARTSTKVVRLNGEPYTY